MLSINHAEYVFRLVLTFSVFFAHAQVPEFTYVGEGFDISEAVYLETFTIPFEEANPNGTEHSQGFKFHSDGKTLYFTNERGVHSIQAYTLDHPYDLSAATHSLNQYSGSIHFYNEDIEFSADGTVMFILEYVYQRVYQFPLTSPYDVASADVSSSLGPDGRTYVLNAEYFSLINEEKLPTGLEFNSDGTKMFVIGRDDHAIVEYHLATPFDVTTASYNGIEAEFDVTQQESNPIDFGFNENGLKMYVIGFDDDALVEYDLATPFQVSTAVYSGTEEERHLGGPYAVRFNQDGTRLFSLFSSLGNRSIKSYALPSMLRCVENGIDVLIDINATDGMGGTEDNSVSYALEGEDASLFAINAAGELSFVSPPDFEEPLDVDADNAYYVDVSVFNGIESRTQTFKITVEDLDDTPPLVTSASSVSVEENGSGVVYTVLTDENASLALGNAKDENEFTLVGQQLSFNSSPDFEAPQDQDLDNDYHIDIIATDTASNGSTFELIISVTDLDEIMPSITSPSAISIEENTGGVVYIAAADETVTFSVGSTKDEDQFLLSTDEISFLAVPDFEVPRDTDLDNQYQLDLKATDLSGNSSTVELTVTVTDKIDEVAPVITSASSKSVQENASGIVYTIIANESSTFTLGSSKDESAFSLSTDAISFVSIPDFEAPVDSDGDNEYLLDIEASDLSGNITLFELAITVTDLDEVPPVITSASSVSAEESASGIVYTIIANESSTFTLGSSKDESAFSLSTDAISFVSILDFEAPVDSDGDNEYLLDIEASDLNGNITLFELAITVTDLDEVPPVLTSAPSVSVEENTSGTAYFITANEFCTYKLGTSKDEDAFGLSVNEILFDPAPDFEAPVDSDGDNEYLLDIEALDLSGNITLFELAITVTDLDEVPPVITSAPIVSVEENTTGTAYFITANEFCTYKLGTSKDEDAFGLSGNEILFDPAPDFEAPGDSDRDNEYLLDIEALDLSGNITLFELAITVTDQDEIPPVITSSSSITVEENSTGVIYQVTSDESATYELGDSKDERAFILISHEISFLELPDYEDPLDLGADNEYLIDLIARDGTGNESRLEVSIMVQDVEEVQPLSVSRATSLEYPLYPNPAQKSFSFSGERHQLQGVERVFLINSKGQLVKSFQFTTANRYEISDLAAGIYTILLSWNSTKETYGKLIIQH